MLEYLWPLSANHGPDVEGQPIVIASNEPTSRVPMQPPYTASLKRKRGQNSPPSSPTRQISSQRIPKALGHAQSLAAGDRGSIVPDLDYGNLMRKTPATGTESATSGIEGRASNSQPEGLLESNRSPAPTIALPPAKCIPETPTQHAEQTASRVTMSSGKLRDIIDSQFNLDILLKHRELRLIDQEMAKCQTAYEQIRRCYHIPYPAQSPHGDGMLSVSDGVGTSYSNKAPHAAPWGVTDGPYSRHYSDWLISAPSLDERDVDAVCTTPAAGKRLPDRHKRGFHSEKGFSSAQSRSRRGSVSSHLNAASPENTEVKKQRGPVIVSRKSDGHMVKLVCLDCRQWNYSSVQGFINHCRIAHTRHFVSHEAAIEASGEEIDTDNNSNLALESATARVPVMAGLVHPMIRAVKPPTPEPNGPKLPNIPEQSPGRESLCAAEHANDSNQSAPSPATINDTASSYFKPSPQTPHLSALLSKIRREGDLDQMVADAQTRDEIDMLQTMDVDESSDEDVDDSAPQSRSTRGLPQCSVRPASASAPGLTATSVTQSGNPIASPQAARRVPAYVSTPAYSPISNTRGVKNNDRDTYLTDAATPPNLSPNITDPHPAPSLVSDDGDFDNTHSESESSSHMDVDNEEDHYIHPNFLDHNELNLSEGNDFNFAQPGKAHAPKVGRRPGPSTVLHSDGDQQRHVTFASPVRAGRQGPHSAAD